jgi:hypothetical protein
MSMAELVAAGAPELPEGYFYRVNGSTLFPRVHIRRSLKIGSVRVRDAESYVLPGMESDARSAVAAACTRAHENWTTRDADRARRLAVQAYAGDHDPRGGAR